MSLCRDMSKILEYEMSKQCGLIMPPFVIQLSAEKKRTKKNAHFSLVDEFFGVALNYKINALECFNKCVAR